LPAYIPSCIIATWQIGLLHAFEKKSRRTAKVDLDLARSRLKEVEALRRGSKEN